MPVLDESLLGVKLDEYRVERALGKGGMARVYLALDTRLQRYVALKVIAPNLRADREYTLRFEQEAQSIARLDHPNIVHIFRFGVIGDLYYMAMQYIDGADLDRLVKAYRRDGERMTLPDVARVVEDIGAALDYAHGRGVIHRDVKPGNIMLDQGGRAVLTDFGLALLGNAREPGEVFGSPHYIAPEQAMASGTVVPQSDLYALGAVLFYMLTGEAPFSGDDPLDVAMRHVSEPPRPPSVLNPALSPEIDAVVLRCLEKVPEKRFQTGSAFSAALKAAIAGQADAPTSASALHHSQQFAVKVQEAQRELPPLPEVDSAPPPPSYQQVTQPVASSPPLASDPASSTWARRPGGPSVQRPTERAERSEPVPPVVGALRRVQPRMWIAAGLAIGGLLVVVLCAALVLSILNRAEGSQAAAAPDTPTPGLTPTLTMMPSMAPSPTLLPTRTAIPTPTAMVLFGTLPPQASFPTVFAPVFPTQPPVFAPPFDRNAPPPGSRRLGEFAVEWYCNQRGLGVTLANGDADWACTNPDGSVSFILQPTDFDQICQTWYTNPGAFAVRDQQKPTQAYNWSCYEYTAQGYAPNLPSNLASIASLATPSVSSLRIAATRDWVAFSNDSTAPLTLANFYLERDGRRVDASAWGRSALNPGECLVIHKGDDLPDDVLSECALPISLPGDKREREYWLKGEVLVYVSPDAVYRYRPER